MNAFHTMAAGAVLALVLGAAPLLGAAPAWAQKLDNHKNPSPGTTTSAPATGIDFGDDAGDWTNDGECDDPRFSGPGTAEELIEADRLHDATDCRLAYEAGTVAFEGENDTDTDAPMASAAIDYGDNASEWAHDGECDDPRFAGAGVAGQLLNADLGHDATDCRSAVEAGTASFTGGASASPLASGEIDYGDDNGEWAKDGECDDPRFSGSGVASELVTADLRHDASDCRAAIAAGTAQFNGEPPPSAPAVFDYGDDSSPWAHDGQCDDPRFAGPGSDKKLLDDDRLSDATDCKALEADGQVHIRDVYTPDYAAGAPYDSSQLDFGDNSSNYADDDQCDDPRFEGPGVASVLLDSDLLRDSADCEGLYRDGSIALKE